MGFRKYHRITLASAGTAAAGTYIEYKYSFEAQDLANSGWNYTSPSSFVTFSFWFRCSTNQTFYTTFRTKDGTEQGYAFSFTATGNNEWTKVVRTIPGNSNLQFDNNNGNGMIFYIFPANGTNYTNNSKSLNEWGAFSSSSYCPDMADTWLTAGASTFDLTGVQLEVGSQATAFEHRTFNEEYRMCMRYYEKSFPYDTAPANNGGNDIDIAGTFFARSHNNSNRDAVRFKVEKRAAPSLTKYGNSSGYWNSPDNGYHQYNNTANGPDATGFYPRQQASGSVIYIQGHYAADAEL